VENETHVETGKKTPRFSWSTDVAPVSVHDQKQFPNYPVPDNYDKKAAFKWMNLYGIKTPPGYSSLFVTPMHQSDLPFYCLPAIVDTDNYHLPVNFPFFLKKGFTGFIEEGTPMVQVIPFKRDDWESEIKEFDNLETQNNWVHFRRKIYYSYKKQYRSRKSFK
jgi:hypothetical protein